MAPFTPDELRVIRSRISMTLANLGECRIYWHVTERRILARSVYVGRKFHVPACAALVGTYRHGVASTDVLDDLADLISTLPEPPTVFEARRDEAELAAPETSAPAAIPGARCAIEAPEALPRAPKRPHPWSAFFRARP
jgi:hypothetical protein